MPLSFIINGFLIEKITVQNTILLNSLSAFLLGIYGFAKLNEKGQ
jgi:hypothetical protein